MKKNPNSIHLALLKVLTILVVFAVSIIIVRDVLAQGASPDGEDKQDESTVVRILKLLFQVGGSAPVEQDYQGNRNCVDTSGGGGNAGADQGFGGSIDTSFDYQSYGLEPPKQSEIDTWYNKLTGNNAYWATRLLKSEKLLLTKGENVKPFLTTAWIWFEYKNALTPYLINCNDNRADFFSEVSFFCNVPNFQIAGYQAASRASGSDKSGVNYVTTFKKCYDSESSLVPVMNDVITNSDKAGVSKWSYLDPNQSSKGLVKSFSGSIGSAKLSDIAPNTSFQNQRDPKDQKAQKGQFLSLLLGKDPCMAIGLNSAAVSDGDLIRGLKTQSCTYGYICRENKRTLAAMVGALKKFAQTNNGSADQFFTPGPSPTPRPTCAPNSGGTGGDNNGGPTGGPLGPANLDNFTHYCQCDPTWAKDYPDGRICQAGCGLNTISAIMTSLGRNTTPPQLRAQWEGKYWFPYRGMDTTRAALKDSFIDKSGFKWDGTTNAVVNGKLDLQIAKIFFTGDLKGKCALVASNIKINHIFAVTGINDDGTITVHDSWLGCQRSGVGPEIVGYRRQNPSYVDNYALPLCLK